MNLEIWNLIFKTGLLAVLSYTIPFAIITIYWWAGTIEIDKKEWLIITLISFVIMVICLLLYGIKITN